jgi:phosphoketolase
MEAISLMERDGILSPNKASDLIKKYKNLLVEHLAYIKEHGEDPDYIANWQWKKTS